jgi:hypothetical protein
MVIMPDAESGAGGTDGEGWLCWAHDRHPDRDCCLIRLVSSVTWL